MKASIKLLLTLFVLYSLSSISVFAQDDMMMDFTLYGTLNPSDLENDAIVTIANDLSSFTADMQGMTAPVTSIESIDFASDGSAYITFDAMDSAGGVAALSSDMSMENPILGASTKLMSPKGLEVIDSMDIIVVANFGGGNILIFPMDASGDVAPMRIVGKGGAEGSIWDIHYNEASDTLFAAGTAGDVFVYDAFSEDMGGISPDRVISPSNAAGEKVSINLHSLYYVADMDTLLISDVGAGDDATDGHLYAIENASTAEGNMTVSLHILGPDSQLGNPVDIVWDGSGLYVAEKANDAILYFGDLLNSSGMMDSTPTSSLAVTKPESLAILHGDMMMDDMSDDMMSDQMMVDSPVYVASNPNAEIDQVIGYDMELGEVATTINGFIGIASIQSLKFDDAGNAYMTVDISESDGGIVVIDGLEGASSMPAGDVMSFIKDDDNSLMSPKGLEVIDSLDLVLVANFGAKNIRGFSLNNPTGIASVSINNFGDVEGSIWDVHYDETSDTLFAAGTTGTLFVYSNFSSNLGSTGPSRMIVPADGDGNPISVNLHGVDYDPQTDTLFLSDVGAADDATDGQIFVITQSGFAVGNTPVAAAIGGDVTMLGNPVDIVFNNGSLYVAEKANDVLLRYDNIITLRGNANQAADIVTSFTKPESIFVR